MRPGTLGNKLLKRQLVAAFLETSKPVGGAVLPFCWHQKATLRQVLGFPWLSMTFHGFPWLSMTFLAPGKYQLFGGGLESG